MPDHPSTIETMIREIEARAARERDNIVALATLLRLVIHSEADPYLLTGVMLEGIAATILQRIPEERQRDVAVETMRMLKDRLHGYGMI